MDNKFDSGGPVKAALEEKKARLRQEMRFRLKQLDPAFREQASREICRCIRKSDVWAASRKILFYAALPSEPDLSPLLLMALQEGKTCVFPKVAGDVLELYRVTEPTDLQKGAYGIWEPVTGTRVEPVSIGLALIPGLAFDRAGFRLGRGRGFYDRLLPGMQGRTTGCCFTFQMQEELPVLEHDARLELLVTENGMVIPRGAL